jgi:polysaccharide deacetylase family protein (PEP-CTERM system associated)
VSQVLNAMTIDVEDYFHVSAFDGVVPRSSWATLECRVERNTDRLLEIFDRHGIKATFFVLGWVAERYPALVRRIAAAGHEIASHGFAHRLVYDLTPSTFRDDVRRSKAVIESAGGAAVHGYRAPSYSITPRSLWALDILIEEGFSYDASIFPIHHDRYGIPVSARHPYRIERKSGQLTEVPGSTVQWGPLNMPVAGGGYFRIFPYQWTAWGIRRINARELRAAIFYLHPWEIDPDQPRLPAGFLTRFRHYRNLTSTEQRLERLIRDFPFGPLRTVLRQGGTQAVTGAQAAPLPYHW